MTTSVGFGRPFTVTAGVGYVAAVLHDDGGRVALVRNNRPTGRPAI